MAMKRILAAALLLVPLQGLALAPVVAAMIKQIVQQSLTSGLKDMLLGSVRDMGCKGIALSNALAALDGRGGAAALRGMTGGMPDMAGMAGMAGVMPAMLGMPTLPTGATLPPEQAEMLAQVQRSMAQPLSPPQTLGAIDEMAELGLLPRTVQAELKECMVLLPQTAPMLGMAMGMLSPVLPKLRDARDQMRALSPAEQDEVAATMAQELQSVPADQRRQFVEQLDAGFFPPAVVAGVKTRLGVR
jgi:hypothetical protein